MNIPFNKPPVLGIEIEHMKKVIQNEKLSGDGPFTDKCQKIMEEKFSAKKILLTPSCTHALELGSLLMDITKGDEVICPSYTFVSSANSFILYGGVPKFVDIRDDTLNIDEKLIEENITDRTKAIMPVHYAGTGCDMDKIMKIAKDHGLYVIEDAAQGVNSRYKNDYLGTIGDIGTYSFHETKNYTCGEGGAIVLNDEIFFERAEIIREKGTNRKNFFEGKVDKYTWVDIGSSYLLSELSAGFLYAQLQNLEPIQSNRKKTFDSYYENFRGLQEMGLIQLPSIPKDCESNYHMFYLILNSEKERNATLKELNENGIHAVFHYIPLHSSPMGLKMDDKCGDLPITDDLSKRLIRLPMFYGLTEEEIDYISMHTKRVITGLN